MKPNLLMTWNELEGESEVWLGDHETGFEGKFKIEMWADDRASFSSADSVYIIIVTRDLHDMGRFIFMKADSLIH